MVVVFNDCYGCDCMWLEASTYYTTRLFPFFTDGVILNIPTETWSYYSHTPNSQVSLFCSGGGGDVEELFCW